MKVQWIAAATMSLVFAACFGRAWAQGAESSGDTSSPAVSGPSQNRDAGERGRRGPGAGRFGGRDRGGRGGDGGNSDNSNSPNGNANTTAAKTTVTSAPPAAPELSDADKARAWAREIIKKNDKNGDGLLQESEQAGLGQSVKADTNGDHVITMDELVAFASRKPGTPSPTAVSNAASSSAESKAAVVDGAASSDRGKKFVKSSHVLNDSKSTKDKSKTYRFKTAKERLPAGLPSWFTSKDANGDGQVEMSEYSKFWSASTAAEFKRYDRDNDGIITSDEALKK